MGRVMTDKKYEIVEHEGQMVRKYPDGSLRKNNGAIVRISAERSELMRRGRKIKGMIQAGKAIQEATDSETVEEGVKKILKARVEVAVNDRGRAGNDAAKLVLLASGHISNERKVDVTKEVKHTAGFEMDEETMEILRKIVEHRREYQVIEGKFSEEERPGDVYKE